MTFENTRWDSYEHRQSILAPGRKQHALRQQWFSRMVRPGSPANCYCLIYTMDDIPVGEISFHNWDAGTRSADLNIKISAVHRGNGYGKDALQTFLSFFFNTVGGRIMRDDVAPGNTGGQHFLISLGFEQDKSVTNVWRLVMTADRSDTSLP